MREQEINVEEQAIMDVIAGEYDAFFRRDFDKYSEYWLHHDGTQRLGTLSGGHVDYAPGWAYQSSVVKRIMENDPEPNLQAGKLVRRENKNFRIFGDMAWLSYDQYEAMRDDPFAIGGLSHQVRILEKHNGSWKIAFAAYGEPRIEHNKFPTIQVDHQGHIEWVNEAAKVGLRNHPTLVQSSGYLRAKTRQADQLLQAAFKKIAKLTPIDVRPQGLTNRDYGNTIPLIFDDEIDDIFHVIWVNWSDGLVLVTFEDDNTTSRILKNAQPIYRLSEAQVKLAELIVKGMDLGQAAEHLNVSINTVRTQIQRMFDKTKVHSQVALVRVLLSTSPPEV